MNFTHCPPRPPRPEERWTNTYEPPITRDSDVADEHDVFETVAAAEEEALEFQTSTSTGNHMTSIASTTASSTKAKRAPKTHVLTANALANPVISAPTLTELANKLSNPAAATVAQLATMPSYHNYFDPIDMLEDHLSLHPMLHARVLNSAAWMLDMACINAARNIVFTRYAESELDANTENRFGTFCQGVSEMLSHDSFYEVSEDSPEKTLALFLAIRRNWHDSTAAAYAADNKDYAPKSFDELLLSEKPRLADAGTRTNYEAIAKHEARGDEAKQKRFMEAFMEADRLSAMSRSDDNKKLIPVLSITLSTVARYAPADARFDQLPIDNQRKLTQAILNSFGRIKLDVAKALARETIMFGHVLEAIYQCTEALGKMIETKYTQVGELEYAGMPQGVTNSERQQKAAAASRE